MKTTSFQSPSKQYSVVLSQDTNTFYYRIFSNQSCIDSIVSNTDEALFLWFEEKNYGFVFIYINNYIHRIQLHGSFSYKFDKNTKAPKSTFPGKIKNFKLKDTYLTITYEEREFQVDIIDFTCNPNEYLL